jgi:hypothetical protein
MKVSAQVMRRMRDMKKIEREEKALGGSKQSIQEYQGRQRVGERQC